MNPNIVTPPTPTIQTKLRSFPRVVLVVILVLGAAFAFYYLNQQKAGKNTSEIVQPARQPSESPIKTEFTNGQVISFKNQVLTIKDKGNQERQIKVTTGASVLKQKWFDTGSMGTVPAEVKAGDQVSVQTAKNSLGETEAISVVILTDKPKTIETASPNGKSK